MRKGRSAFETVIREGDLEDKCRRFANQNGFEFLKNTAANGEMDRFLLGKLIAPSIVFIEMKTTTGVVEDLQKHKIRKRKKQGYAVMVVRDYIEFIEIINAIKGNFGIPLSWLE